MLLQNHSFATYGVDDTELTADCETIRRYAGKSALSAMDAISIQFLRGTQWTETNRNESKAVRGCFVVVSECSVVSSLR